MSIPRFLSRFVLLTLFISLSIPFQQTSAAIIPFSSQAIPVIGAVVGQALTVQVNVLAQSWTLRDGIVDLEIYNERNERQYQKFFEHQDIDMNQPKQFQVNWTPTATGSYILKLGVFSNGWSQNFYWTDSALSFSVDVKSSSQIASSSTATQPSVVQSPATVSAISGALNVWWPKEGVAITGVQPFKMELTNNILSGYNAYWQVDGGQWNAMSDSNSNEGPHKEMVVDVTGWNWKGTGPYTLTFIAQKRSTGELTRQNIIIYTGQNQTTTNQNISNFPTGDASVTQTTNSAVTANSSVFSASGLYVNSHSPALAQAEQWKYSRPADALMMKKIGDQPSSRWFGGWNSNVYTEVKNYVDAAAAVNQTPVLVAYNIPQRDCGGYSAGGTNSPDAYRSWIDSMANGIGNRDAIVVLEPDSIALTDCLSSSDRQTRFELLSYAVNSLKSKSGIKVYIDAGHPNWISVSEMANRLRQANIDRADGFALNVSNYYATAENINYGTQISQIINNKHFIIDTSRNGLGSNGQWCNAPGRALGDKPTLNTGNSLVDGYIWIKTPGESDGYGNGGPAAGQWWPEYALGLAQRAAW